MRKNGKMSGCRFPERVSGLLVLSAQRRGITKSEVLREATEVYIGKIEPTPWRVLNEMLFIKVVDVARLEGKSPEEVLTRAVLDYTERKVRRRELSEILGTLFEIKGLLVAVLERLLPKGTWGIAKGVIEGESNEKAKEIMDGFEK